MPKCTICGKEVDGIGPLDVPYHVECVMVRCGQIRRFEGAYQLESALAHALLPAARMLTRLTRPPQAYHPRTPTP
jgi:hypothetical protein